MTERDRLAEDPEAADDGEDEDLFPDWFDEWIEPPPPPTIPWYRNIRVLGTLIGIAFLALLISTVLLFTLDSTAEFPTGTRFSTPTSPAEPARTTAASTVPQGQPETSTAPSATEVPSPPETAAPAAPAVEPAAPPPPGTLRRLTSVPGSADQRHPAPDELHPDIGTQALAEGRGGGAQRGWGE